MERDFSSAGDRVLLRFRDGRPHLPRHLLPVLSRVRLRAVSQIPHAVLRSRDNISANWYFDRVLLLYQRHTRSCKTGRLHEVPTCTPVLLHVSVRSAQHNVVLAVGEHDVASHASAAADHHQHAVQRNLLSDLRLPRIQQISICLRHRHQEPATG